MTLSLFTFMHWRRKWQPTPEFLPGESQGQGSLVGCRLWGRTESGTTEATQQQQQQCIVHLCLFVLSSSRPLVNISYIFFFVYLRSWIIITIIRKCKIIFKKCFFSSRQIIQWWWWLLSRFSRVRLYVIPQTAAHQAPLSLEFSRQEYWSGLPFPSPMHACMLSRFSHVQLCVTLWTAAHQAPLSTKFSRQEYWSGLSFLSPNTVIERELLLMFPYINSFFIISFKSKFR